MNQFHSCIRLWLSCIVVSGLTLACGGTKKRGPHGPEFLDFASVRPALTLFGKDKAEDDTDCFNGKKRNCHVPYVAIRDNEQSAAIQTILSQTYISDDWLVERFRSFMEGVRPEVLSMFSCVKGVVLSRNVRPAGFYYGETGAIYLDSIFFAQSEEEVETVSSKPDPRADNYQGTKHRIYSISLPYKDSDLDLSKIFQNVLIHELTHACDFKKKELEGRYISDDLPSIPLNSVYSMAQFLQRGGESARKSLESYTLLELGSDFETGSPSDPYGYSSPFENLAMLVQDMTAFEFDGKIKTHFIPDRENSTTEKPIVQWALKGKLCQPEIFERARVFSDKVFPSALTWTKDISECPTILYPLGTLYSELK